MRNVKERVSFLRRNKENAYKEVVCNGAWMNTKQRSSARQCRLLFGSWARCLV